jgi:hypothetical protein
MESASSDNSSIAAMDDENEQIEKRNWEKDESVCVVCAWKIGIDRNRNPKPQSLSYDLKQWIRSLEFLSLEWWTWLEFSSSN